MNVLLFIDSLVLGGAQKQLVNLALALRSKHIEVSICTYYPLQGAMLKQDLDQFDFTCFQKSHRWDISPAFKLAKKIKHCKPDVVVAFLSTPCIYAELTKLLGSRTPIVVSERNGLKTDGSKFFYKLQAYLHLLANKVVFNNHSYCDQMSSSFSHIAKRADVIYNGVDQRFFAGIEHRISKKEILGDQRAGSSAGAFKFCVVSARPNKEKGLFDLIEAASILLNKKHLRFQIDWIGPCDQNLKSVQLAQKEIQQAGLSSVWRWCGVQDDLFGVYPHYNALVIPSHREGLSNVLCEAMASGLPCVVSDVSDHLSIVRQNDAGIVYSCEDVNALAEGMSLLVENRHGRTLQQACNASSYAHQNFTTEKFKEKWVGLLEELGA